MEKKDKKYEVYLQILREELVPAMGCTEPIAISYCAAKARDILGEMPHKVLIEVSGNIIKNVKSVIVPNTNGLKGIEAAAAAGIVAGKSEKILEVIASVTEEEKAAMKDFMETREFIVLPAQTDAILDIEITLFGEGTSSKVCIRDYHTNIVRVEKDGQVLFETGVVQAAQIDMADKSLLNIKDICDFARTVDIDDVKPVLDRQIEYNTRISQEGLKNNYGANVGSVLLSAYGNDVHIRAKAVAAAGSDARMSGCELPVIINSGSGNQGMTASLPVIEYAKEWNTSEEELYRALVVSNLTTIHQKSGIGRLSAFCGAVSAGCGAGAGIAWLDGGGFEGVAHTLVNALAVVSGIVCDGAKPSCAAKIAASVDAGLLGYHMYKQGQEFKGGEGIISKGVENTIHNIGRLSQEGMKETDKEIIRIMTDC